MATALSLPFDGVATAPATLKVRNFYEAGTKGRRAVGWNAPTTSSNQAVLAHLATLRDRSRAAVRNDGYAKGAIDKLVSNIVGTGIKPMSLIDDPALRAAVQAGFTRWTDESDADGLLDFYGQQGLVTRTWLEGGECFVRHRDRLASDGLTVPLQLQVLEPELCPHTHDALTATSRVRAGIEFSRIGKRVAYWFHPSRPEQDDFDASRLVRVPADMVSHVFEPLRAGMLRGLPHLTQALVTLFELSKFSDAVLLRQQLSNLFVAFVTRDSRPETDALHPIAGVELDEDGEKPPLLPLRPGIFQELEPGDDVKFSTPPAPEGYADFMQQKLYETAAATGVPYEVITGDLSKITDRTVRVVLNEFRRRIQAWQHQIIAHQFCRPIWRAWMDRAFLAGSLPLPADYILNPEPYLAVKWVPQGWPYMHPVQDVQAAEKAVRAGFRSRSAVVSEQGEDAEVIDAEQRADNERADEFGLVYDSDGRTKAAAVPATGDDQQQPDQQPAGANA